MNENILNVELINKLLERKDGFEIGEKVEFTYKNDNGNIWNLSLRREEEQYSPFMFSIEGKKVGTNETWGRRYNSLEQAILHIANCFNENANIQNRYSNLDEYIATAKTRETKENIRKSDYMMLDRLRTDCEYFLGNGNGYLGHLYYKDVDKHIEEMKKIYESFSDEEKPEWISLEDIDNYKQKMNEMIERSEEEEI